MIMLTLVASCQGTALFGLIWMGTRGSENLYLPTRFGGWAQALSAHSTLQGQEIPFSRHENPLFIYLNSTRLIPYEILESY
jgi:hypothetical protein